MSSILKFLQINTGPPSFQSFPSEHYVDHLRYTESDIFILKDDFTRKVYMWDNLSKTWVQYLSEDEWNLLIENKLDQFIKNKLEETNMSENRSKEEFGSVSLLGNQNTRYPTDYDPTILETFVNKHQDTDYVVTLDAYEFTSKCPKTGQPDFAKMIISYIPNVNMVESKSLKLYLFSFRNEGSFHEDCVNIIMEDLIQLMNPKYIEVRGVFSPRGGISIFPFANWANSEFNFEDFARSRKLDVLRDSSNRAVRFDK